MKRTIQVLVVCLCGLAVAGCEIERISFGTGDGAARRGEWLETDRLTYVAHYTHDTIELDIGFTYHNRSGRAVAIPRCERPYRPVIDKLVLEHWQEVFTPVESCWDVPLVVPAGSARSFLFRVRAGRTTGSSLPRFRTATLPGTYRLRLEVYEHDPLSADGVGRLLPVSRRTSNSFRIVD